MSRLDVYLTEKKFAETRSIAQNLIRIKKVTVNGIFPHKTGVEICDSDIVCVNNDIKASIGCYKLQHAINHFNLSKCIENKICMDIGASNGGFTYVLLENAASKVYAVDIGANMLPEELTNNSKVVIRDTINAKTMTYDIIGENVDIITIDVSFIGLDKILPNLIQFLTPDSVIIALLKPQFEVGAKNLTKNGIVKSTKLYDALLKKYAEFLKSLQLHLIDSEPIPKLFEKKNVEFLLLIKPI